MHGGRTAGVGVGRVRCSSFATGSGGKASRLSGAARVIAGVNFRRNLRLRNVNGQRGSRRPTLIMLSNFDHFSRFVPLTWVVASQILNADVVSLWRYRLRMFCPSLGVLHVANA